MAKHIYTYVNPSSERDLAQACKVLENDGVIAYPTDVNWAFGCDASSRKAIARIRQLKPHHPREQPFSLLCNSISMVASVGYIENSAYRLLKKCLPGPYTLLLQRTHDLPRQIKDKRKIVGVRVPDCPLLLDLVGAYGKPIATTSMPCYEQKDKKPATYGFEVEEQYGHGIDLILDLGEEMHPNETSIVDMSDDSGGKIIRVGSGDISLFERFGFELS